MDFLNSSSFQSIRLSPITPVDPTRLSYLSLPTTPAHPSHPLTCSTIVYPSHLLDYHSLTIPPRLSLVQHSPIASLSNMFIGYFYTCDYYVSYVCLVIIFTTQQKVIYKDNNFQQK